MCLQNSKLVPQWAVFRRRKLVELFERRLKAAGVDEENIGTQIANASQVPNIVRSKQFFRPIEGRTLHLGNADSILGLAQAALSHLTENQIRNLKIPLGAVWDVLQRRS